MKKVKKKGISKENVYTRRGYKRKVRTIREKGKRYIFIYIGIKREYKKGYMESCKVCFRDTYIIDILDTY